MQGDILSNSEVAGSSSTSNDSPITIAADLLRRGRNGQPIVPESWSRVGTSLSNLFGDRQNIRVNVNDGPRRVSGQFNDLPLNEGPTPSQNTHLDHPLQRDDLRDVDAPSQDRQSIRPGINAWQRRRGSRFLGRHIDNEDADISPKSRGWWQFLGHERHNLGEASQHGKMKQPTRTIDQALSLVISVTDPSPEADVTQVPNGVDKNGRNANGDLVHPGQIQGG